MYFDFLRNTREGFVDMRSGDKLILVESIIIGVISFIVMLINGYEFVMALAVGLGCILVVSTLVALVPVIAWIVGIVFSLIWAVISYFIGGAILGDSPVAGGIIAVFVFLGSMFLHKVFAGIGYSSVRKCIVDSVVDTRNNTEYIANNIYTITEDKQQWAQTAFCPYCGVQTRMGANFCQTCGSRL